MADDTSASSPSRAVQDTLMEEAVTSVEEGQQPEDSEEQVTGLDPAAGSFVPSQQSEIDRLNEPGLGSPDAPGEAGPQPAQPPVQWGLDANLAYMDKPAPSSLPAPHNNFTATNQLFGAGVNPLTIGERHTGDPVGAPFGLGSYTNIGPTSQYSYGHDPWQGNSQQYTAGADQQPGGYLAEVLGNPVENLLPNSVTEADQLLSIPLWRPKPPPGEERIPRNHWERAALAWELKGALEDISRVRDRGEPEFSRFARPPSANTWTEAEIMAISWRVVRTLEDLYANGSSSRVFRISINVPAPNSPDTTMGLSDRLRWLARLVREFKTFADIIMQEGTQTIQFLARPRSLYYDHVEAIARKQARMDRQRMPTPPPRRHHGGHGGRGGRSSRSHFHHGTAGGHESWNTQSHNSFVYPPSSGNNVDTASWGPNNSPNQPLYKPRPPHTGGPPPRVLPLIPPSTFIPPRGSPIPSALGAAGRSGFNNRFPGPSVPPTSSGVGPSGFNTRFSQPTLQSTPSAAGPTSATGAHNATRTPHSGGHLSINVHNDRVGALEMGETVSTGAHPGQAMFVTAAATWVPHRYRDPTIAASEDCGEIDEQQSSGDHDGEERR